MNKINLQSILQPRIKICLSDPDAHILKHCVIVHVECPTFINCFLRKSKEYCFQLTSSYKKKSIGMQETMLCIKMKAMQQLFKIILLLTFISKAVYAGFSAYRITLISGVKRTQVFAIEQAEKTGNFTWKTTVATLPVLTLVPGANNFSSFIFPDPYTIKV